MAPLSEPKRSRLPLPWRLLARSPDAALRWGTLVTACLLVPVCVGLAWTGHVDRVAAERYANRLETLSMLDSELSAEVLKTRTGLVPHYDGLMRAERSLDASYATLRELPEFLDGMQREHVAAELAAAERASRITLRLVEQFKSENAVLRNSLLFLRTAAVAIDAYPGTTPEERAFRERASALVRDVLLLRLLQDTSVLDRVSRELVELTQFVELAPAARRPELQLVLSHARTVRERSPAVDRMIREIVAQPAVAHAQRLIALYARYHRAALAAASHSTAWLLSLLLAVGGLVAAVVIARMRRSAAALRRTGAQLKDALTALQAEQAKQRELSELKTRFVSMTSHEFRTPLSTIMSSSEMLCAYDQRWSKEKKAGHFERIRTAVIHMTRMLDAILLIGKSESGRLEFNPRKVQLARFCAEVADAATKALTEHHELKMNLPDDDALFVVADEALLRHVAENLLSNAIKYSPQGGEIDFGVTCESDVLVFEVRDRGIGIPARDRERLFEVFHRGTNVGSVAGSGLGLSIVKRAVDLHGGSVDVESEVGRGTRFVVRMPCARSAA